jgi:glucose/arabinose dehydrogenase
MLLGMRCALLLVLLLVPGPALAQLRAELVASGLTRPVGVVTDPLDPGILFVIEQAGVIRVVRDGQVLDEPFLDLRDQIASGGERGLLGLAFVPPPAPPDTPDAAPPQTSRRFWVNFTNQNGDTVIARFERREDDPLKADINSRFDLRWPSGDRFIAQPFSNHNGGHLAFGPDGYLYIGMGDGGSGGDPFNHAQRPDTLLGKMLRIDISVDDQDENGYRIPEDNPFVDGLPISALGEIWAFGLRNPWKFSFDDPARGGQGGMVVADVGQNMIEEINFEPPGAGGRNYGWRLREGRGPFDTRKEPAFPPLTDPIHQYDRTKGASVTGGYIYRGSALPESYRGRYFYGDFVDGRVFSVALHPQENGEVVADDEIEHTDELGGTGRLGLVSAFGLDANGELLVVNYDAGEILRIVPATGDRVLPECGTVNPLDARGATRRETTPYSRCR